ncbi:MAG: hypothetical protein K5668_07630 [Lachnospiraceae bacterium]|nr:hypothetical protein [Lachnospiraceae bacterium]
MKKIKNYCRKITEKILVFLITAAAIMTAVPEISVYSAYADTFQCGIFSIYLTEQSQTVRSLTARIIINDYEAYKRMINRTTLTFCWDCVNTDRNQNVGMEYVITTPGTHVLNIYTSESYPYYGSTTFNVNNIDNRAPVMGALSADYQDDTWTITLEGCEDDHSTGDKIKYLCLKEEDANNYRSGNSWNESSLFALEGWTDDMTFPIEEGKYCVLARDEAGNVAEKSLDTGHVDREPPHFNSEPEIIYEGEVNGYAKAALISIDAEDNNGELSGYPYSFNNGATWQQGNELRVVENGAVTILLKDETGNISEAKTVEITNLDNQAPSISLSGKDNNTNDGSTVINVTASDTLSGVCDISYQNDEVGVPVILAGGSGSGSGNMDASVTIKNNGSYTFFARDVMGNTSFEKINVVRSVKTEYKDSSEKKDKDGDKNKDKNKDNKDKNKDSGSGGTGSGSGNNKETRIINPGNGSGGNGNANGNGSSNGSGSSQKDTGSDKKIIIKDSDAGGSSDSKGKGTDGKSEGSDGNSKKTRGASGNSALKGSSGIGSSRGSEYTVMNRDDDADDGDPDEENEDNKEDTESTEIREVTLDEYLSSAPKNAAAEEEIIPELLDEEEEEKNEKSSRGGKIAMIAAILLLLTALTIFLLIKKEIISLPDMEEDEERDEDTETGVLGIANMVKGFFAKSRT